MIQLGERFPLAVGYACTLHAGQVRKGSQVPYVAHLLSVAAIVLEYGGDETAAIAALLHDAVEDQGGAKTAEEIQRRFGDAVAEIVRACSDTDQTPKPPWRQRKEEHLEKLRDVPPPAALVMAADKLHNARSLAAELRVGGEAVWGQFKGGREGTLWYIRAVWEALAPAVPAGLAAELGRAVDELERCAPSDAAG